MSNLHPNRNEIVEIFRKFSLHRGMRLNMMHDLIDEINDYYESKYVSKDFHERHLKEQLGGWITHLENLKVGGTSQYAQGFKEGVKQCIETMRKA